MTQLSIQGGMVTSTDSRVSNSFHLRVEDKVSGELLADVMLTPDQWLRVTSGSHITAEGTVGRHLDRVGRKQVVRQLSVPRDALSTYNRDTSRTEAMNWGLRHVETDESMEVRQTNSGWVVIYRSWPTADGEA